jgi:lipoprotein-anchoring transpeptidase ErfK/SrfK
MLLDIRGGITADGNQHGGCGRFGGSGHRPRLSTDGRITVGEGADPSSASAGTASRNGPSASSHATGTQTGAPSTTQQVRSTPKAAPSVPTTATTTTRATPTIVPPVATVSSEPALSSSGLSPVQPITVRVAKGTITEVTLTNPTGYQVKGLLSADRSSWTTAEVLGFGRKYTLAGTAVGNDGKSVPIIGSYTMVRPKNEVRTTISPGDRAVVGVAMPIVVKFAVEPRDRALIEKNVKVTTVPRVQGAWGWIQHDEGEWGLDYRPKGYWPSGTKVHVEANLYGLEFAPGAYGKTSLSSDFTIGRNQVVAADAKAHKIVVTRNGKVVASYNASFGSVNDDRETRSGIHVVNDKFADKIMVSEKFHYREREKWAVRISNNGEFIHANPKTIDVQGRQNVSHGCINLSDADARAYFTGAMVGDPVEVTGTGVRLGPQDGDIFDYAIPWSEWVTLSALG